MLQNKTVHPGIDLLIFLLLAVGSFMLFMFLGILLAVPFFNMSFDEVMHVFSDFESANVALYKFMQIIQSIGLFVFPAIIYNQLRKKDNLQYYSFTEKTYGKQLFVVIFIMIAALPAINALAYLNEQLRLPSALQNIEESMKAMEENAAKITLMLLHADTFGDYLINLFMIAVLPAVGEEIFFRGIMQKMLHRGFKNAHLAIIVTAIFFSTMHMQFYGFLPRMLMGILFGYMLVWTNNIWYPILAHFINNGLAVTVAYFMGVETAFETMEEVGTTANTFYILAISLVLTCWFIYRLFKLEKARQQKLLQ